MKLFKEKTAIKFPAYTIRKGDDAKEGDLRVVYKSRTRLKREYQQAIEILDFNDQLKLVLLKDTFGTKHKDVLKKAVKKSHIWLYPPEQRDDVKEAKEFLEWIVQADIPYGESTFIPAREVKIFEASQTERFGIEEKTVCVDESLMEGMEYQLHHNKELVQDRTVQLIQHPFKSVVQTIHNAFNSIIPDLSIPQKLSGI